MYINTTDSTNSLLRQLWQQGHAPDHIRCDYQTSGRGQAGNGWESTLGENILLSIGEERLPIRVEDQWRVSMLFALVVVEAIAEQEDSPLLTIKWPNDIYWGDHKIGGILIEHILDGKGLAYTILGLGLNVNQTQWQGNAPNPSSLRLLTGREWQVETLCARIVSRWRAGLPHLNDAQVLHRDYMARLYRREGWHWYEERRVDTTPTMPLARAQATEAFEARIIAVSPVGELILETRDGQQHTYHFKQVRFIL